MELIERLSFVTEEVCIQFLEKLRGTKFYKKCHQDPLILSSLQTFFWFRFRSKIFEQ